MDRGGNKYYYFYDGLGSVTELVDNSSTVVENYTYDPYGNSVTMSSVGNPYGFKGRRFDAESALYHYRRRAYNPEIGRFLQRDPIGYDDGMNLFAYVKNSPVNFTDPLGLWGIGIYAGESTEVGVVIGAGQTASVGGGVFGEGVNVSTINAGSFASGGAFAGGPGYGVSTVSGSNKANGAVGAYAGAGAGLFITSASSVGDLGGPGKTYSFNAGWGYRVASFQFTRGENGHWAFYYGGPIPPLAVTGGGFGFDFAVYDTYTKTNQNEKCEGN